MATSRLEPRWQNAFEGCAERWGLTRDGDPMLGGTDSLVLPVEARDGSAAVLKIQVPHRESEHEADALTLWAGRGAVRLLAEDRSLDAMLLERCVPGTPLSALMPDADAALDVAIGLLPRLWIPVPSDAPLRSLAEEAAWWASYLPVSWDLSDRPCERSLVEAALTAIDELSGTQGEQVLLSQDLHADNVLRASREPWLAVDPKPLTGEREFGVGPLVRGDELGGGKGAAAHRLDRLTEALGLDRKRTARWAFVQTLAWSFDEDDAGRATAFPGQIEVARWFHDLARG